MSATTRASISALHLSRAQRRREHPRRRQPRAHRRAATASCAIMSASEVEGYNDTGGSAAAIIAYKVYFVARFSKPAVALGTWQGTAPARTTPVPGAISEPTFASPQPRARRVDVRLGLSYVSIAECERQSRPPRSPTSASFDQVAGRRAGAVERRPRPSPVTGGTRGSRGASSIPRSTTRCSIPASTVTSTSNTEGWAVPVSDGSRLHALSPVLLVGYLPQPAPSAVPALPAAPARTWSARWSPWTGRAAGCRNGSMASPRAPGHGRRSGGDRDRRHLPEGDHRASTSRPPTPPCAGARPSRTPATRSDPASPAT